MPSFSVSGKDYVLLSYVRDGDDWSHPFVEEIPGPQADLKKIVKKNDGKALPQLENMGKGRRKQIMDSASDLTAQESGDVFWEAAFIKNLDEGRNAEGKVSVRAFKVIFARRSRRSEQAPKRKSNIKVVTVKQPVPPKAPEPPKAKGPAKEEGKEKEKPKAARRQSQLNDPFSLNTLFSQGGHPMDERGPIPFNNAGLPAHISLERPIGTRPPPKEEPPKPAAQKSDPLLQRPPGGFEDIFAELDNIQRGEIDGIVEVPETQPHQSRWERPASRLRNPSRPRQRSSVHTPDDRADVRASNRFSDHYPSSRSSWASEEGSVILGEWDDLSSRTSNDTHGSFGRSPAPKTYRVPQAPAERRYYRDARHYQYRDNDTRLQVANSRRQRTIEGRNDHAGLEQPNYGRHSPARPLVHQHAPPPARQTTPLPTAEYPAYYAREPHTPEQVQEMRADDYMRDAIRREDERRERERQFEAVRNQVYGGGQPRRYTYEPREQQQQHYYGR